jgi:hypothetical protein
MPGDPEIPKVLEIHEGPWRSLKITEINRRWYIGTCCCGYKSTCCIAMHWFLTLQISVNPYQREIFVKFLGNTRWLLRISTFGHRLEIPHLP